ncbi:hypothetical protein HH308_06295 [Gordonia sp. TBRC 11910]|uniref:LtfC/p132/Gp6 beta-sandwich domain-containing protein n=1 Tax=Gordonia asplenii TaxID=2725283 RepID=A0A848KRE1_9ACTN|nr:hypothetical protein [Gordonia asplenii]NMO00822.1 hypothetical protein [Gordonia asplenii]
MSCGDGDWNYDAPTRDLTFYDAFDFERPIRLRSRKTGLPWEPPADTQVFLMFGEPTDSPTVVQGDIAGATVTFAMPPSGPTGHDRFPRGTPVRLVVKLPTDTAGRLLSVGEVNRR